MTNKERERLFEREFYPHLDALHNFAMRLSGQESDADDLVQDTFLKAWRFIESYQRGTNAKAWLFRILRNSFINEFRKKSKQPHASDFSELDERVSAGDDDQFVYTPVDLRVEVFKNLLGDEVTGALQRLDLNFRLIILLSDVEEFTYEEISKILDIPIGTVRSRLHRARNELKSLLANYAKTMGYHERDENTL